MGAFLCFARDWDNSGYFIEAVGDKITWDVTYGQLAKIVSFGLECGIPEESWPNYVDIDGRSEFVTLEDIYRRNDTLRVALRSADPRRLDNFRLSTGEQVFQIICEWIDKGYLLFITH